jgi:hypothetical protein
MNYIIFEKANIFDKIKDYEFIIGMGSLGLSCLGTAARDFAKKEMIDENDLLKFEKIITLKNGKNIYFIADDGVNIGGISDEKLVAILEKLFRNIKKHKITKVAMNIQKPDTDSNNSEFLRNYKNIYRIYLIMDYLNYLTDKLKLDNMEICICDLYYNFKDIKYIPFVENEKNIYLV